MNAADIPVFILCGGLGTRIKEEAEFRPKPMVPIGEHSILWLATALAQPKLVDAEAKDVLTAFNFGPEKEANRTVVELVGEILKSWPGRWDDQSNPNDFHEAKLLMLSTAKAKKILHWQPTWKFETAIAHGGMVSRCKC